MAFEISHHTQLLCQVSAKSVDHNFWPLEHFLRQWHLSKMAGFNISLTLNEKQSSSDKKHNKSLRLVLFYRQWIKRNYSTPFLKCFSLFKEKNPLSKTFLVECVRSGAESCNKRREFGRETHTPLWLLIGRIIFLTREKVRNSDWTYHIFHVWKPSFVPLIG